MAKDNLVKFKKSKRFSSKKLSAFFVLLLTLTAVPMVNTIVSKNNNDSGRTIASSKDSESDRRSLRRLAKKSAKTLYSVGRKANNLEQFQYGELYGHYTIKREINKISQVHLASEENIITVKDRLKFIKKHKDIWYVDFDSIKKLSETLDGDVLVEEFSLFEDGKSVGQINVRSKYDGLLQILVSKVEDQI